MTIRDRITISDDQLAQLCLRFRVRELALYGSVLREDFRDDSDIDILVDYESDTRRGLLEHFGLQNVLEDLTRRRVDLVSVESLHPLIRAGTIATARSIWPVWEANIIDAARPFRREWLQLHVLLEAADDLASMLEGVDRAEFMANDLLKSAVIVPLRQIGSLAEHLPDAIRSRYAENDWAGWTIRGERLISRYYNVDWDDVWSRATVDAPDLRSCVATILSVEFPHAVRSRGHEP